MHNMWRPFFLRALSTLRPLCVILLARKPETLTRFLLQASETHMSSNRLEAQCASALDLMVQATNERRRCALRPTWCHSS